MENSKSKSAETIGKIAVILLLLLATTFVASAQPPCDHNVTCTGWCCYPDYTTVGWFYNETSGSWEYLTKNVALFHLSVDGSAYDAYCINITAPLAPEYTFNASIYSAEPTCKNNSIAYILNNWTHDCDHCDNVAAAQSAIWYLWYINDTFCRLGEPKYNHSDTTTPSSPEWESYWIPNCTAHPAACAMIDASINKSVPYAIITSPSSGSFPYGTPIELTTTVLYCTGEGKEEVTVVFETDKGKFSESNAGIYETLTANGIATATLICDPSVDSAHVTVWVKDMKWFDIVDPCGPYQATLRITNITDAAAFSFYKSGVPALTPIGIAALIGLLSVVVALSINKGVRRKRK